MLLNYNEKKIIMGDTWSPKRNRRISLLKMIKRSTYVFFKKQKGDKPEVNELPVNVGHFLTVLCWCLCFAAVLLLLPPSLCSLSSSCRVCPATSCPTSAGENVPHLLMSGSKTTSLKRPSLFLLTGGDFSPPERPENFVYTSNQLLARVLHSGYQTDFVLWRRQGPQDNILPAVVPSCPALDNQGQASLDRISHSMEMRRPVTTSRYITQSDSRRIPKF